MKLVPVFLSNSGRQIKNAFSILKTYKDVFSCLIMWTYLLQDPEVLGEPGLVLLEQSLRGLRDSRVGKPKQGVELRGNRQRDFHTVLKLKQTLAMFL